MNENKEQGNDSQHAKAVLPKGSTLGTPTPPKPRKKLKEKGDVFTDEGDSLILVLRRARRTGLSIRAHYPP
jgi:hypothetical protein